MTENKNMKLSFSTPEGKAAKSIVAEIKSAGGQAFIVGGAVRDAILKMDPKDVDVATDLLPSDLVRIFGRKRVKFVGESFGVAIVKQDGQSIEVATFREDGEYTDGRRPDTVEFSNDPEIDSRRRDLTMNALFFDPVDEVILDFHGGLQDIEEGVIRTVGDPKRRFSEDFLRMLRAIRFASRFKFGVAPDVQKTIKEMAHKIEEISGERIFMELDKMMTKSPVMALSLMRRLHILQHVLPEVEAMIGVQQPPQHHPEGCVWSHVLLVLSHMDTPASSELAWAALLHDIGKPLTKGVNKKGDICFHGHEGVGANMAEEILKERFRCSNKFTKAVCDIIEAHVRVAGLSNLKIGKIRRHMARETIDNEIELCRLDTLGKGSNLRGLKNHDKLVELRERFRNEPAVPDPLLTGHELIALGVPRGPEIGDMLRQLEELQLQGDISCKEEAMDFVRKSQ